MGTTTTWDLPYPEDVTKNDLHQHFMDLADATDAALSVVQSSSGFSARDTDTVSTASLADGATGNVTLTLKPGYRVLKVETNVPARVRVYDSAAHRTSDASRPVGTDPSGVHGVVLDLVTTASTLAFWLSPVVDGYTADASDTVPLAVTNLSGAASVVTVTVTWIRSE